jgi:hypothetical protein
VTKRVVINWSTWPGCESRPDLITVKPSTNGHQISQPVLMSDSEVPNNPQEKRNKWRHRNRDLPATSPFNSKTLPPHSFITRYYWKTATVSSAVTSASNCESKITRNNHKFINFKTPKVKSSVLKKSIPVLFVFRQSNWPLELVHILLSLIHRRIQRKVNFIKYRL